MMKDILQEIRGNNIDISVEGDNLKVYSDSIVPEHLLRTLRERKIDLIAYLKKQQQDSIEVPAIPGVEDLSSTYPLSSSQRRLWILSQFGGSNVAYNIPSTYRLEGNVDVYAVQRAFEQLIGRHEILRTVFVENPAGEVQQQVVPVESLPFELDYQDLRGVTDPEACVQGLVQQEYVHAFDLTNGPLFRAGLYRLSSESWVLSYTMHHIISDGWSMSILIKELLYFYNCALKGKVAALPALRIHYKDYACWQQQQLDHAHFKAAKSYWLDRFSGDVPVLHLPLDRPRPSTKTFNGGTVTGHLTPLVSRRFKSLATEEGGTLFMGLLALTKVLLYHYSGQEDIVIGSPIAGRDHADLSDQIGFYVNTLALRTQFSGQDSFRVLLARVKETTLSGYDHQIYPFDELVDSLALERDLSRSPVFDVMMALQNNESFTESDPEDKLAFSVTAYNDTEYLLSKFDLIFSFLEIKDHIQVKIEYNSDLFDLATIERMCGHLAQLAELVAGNADQPVGSLDYLTAAEREQVLYSFNQTQVAYPARSSVVSCFEDQVRRTPSCPAIIFEGNTLSYSELNELSNRFADYLRTRHEISGNDLVGIRLERSEWVVVLLLAVLKSGAAYVPIDPEYPADRVGYMINDSGCKVVIGAEELAYFRSDVQAYSAENPGLPVQPVDLAYIMYTSGSTGRPKGVMVQHNAIVRLIWNPNYVSIDASDVVLGLSTFSFDGSVFDIFVPLLNGACLCIAGKSSFLDSEELHRTVNDNAVSIVFITTALFNSWIDLGYPCFGNMKYVLFGGELVSTTHVDKFLDQFPDTRLVHVYGPTENTTFSSFYPVIFPRNNASTVPIGKAISNSQCYIFRNFNGTYYPVPVGVIGDIYVGGDGLSLGYLNNESLSAEKFHINPYTGQRMYQTGDLGKLLPDGNIVFLGRYDDQVKIRGHRIELGEIEKALLGLQRVTSALVTVESGSDGDQQLIAYLTGDSGFNSLELRRALANELPAFMLPSAFIFVESFPLTHNGKIDKKKLRELRGDQEGASEGIGPRNSIEKSLLTIWRNILGIQAISVLDNFFELGGHSLKATKLINQIHQHFEIKLSLKDLFANPLLADQAQLIAESTRAVFEEIKVQRTAASYVLSSSQRRLWILSQFGGSNVAYNIPSTYRLEGNVDVYAVQRAFEQLIGRHEILRTVFVENPAGEVQQQVVPVESLPFELDYQDLRGVTDPEACVQGLVQQEYVHAFDLTNGPLFRAGLYRLSSESWVLSYTMHHIISDGWSMSILIKELLYFYNCALKGKVAALPALRIHYKDYACWQQQQLDHAHFKAAKSYWLDRFSGDVPVLHLPLDRPRPSTKTFNGGTVTGHLTPLVSRRFKSLATEEGGTLFMGLLALTKVLLYHYSGQEDIVIGSPIAGRDHADLSDQIGFYVNTLALRTQFSGQDSFRVLLARVKETTLSGYDHQIYPFDELVDSLALERDLSRSPVFDVMMALQNNDRFSYPDAATFDFQIEAYGSRRNIVSKFDLTFDFLEDASGLHFGIEYNSDLFDLATIERMCGHLAQLAELVAGNADQPVGSLDYLTAAEREQVLYSFNQTQVAYPARSSVVSCFEDQVRRTPSCPAIIFEGNTLSYSELNELSNRFADYLRTRHEISGNDLVGIRLERSEWVVVLLLAVLKSGAAYVPIDPEYPADRVDYMINDSGCKVVIGAEELAYFRSDVQAYSAENPRLPVQPVDLAYIMYTSGSTGRPKGVIVQHSSVYDYCMTFSDMFKIGTADMVLQQSSVSFDTHVEEIFPSLLNGACLVISRHGGRDIEFITEMIGRRMITVISTTPSLLYELNKSLTDFGDLRLVISGGEVLRHIHVDRILKSVEVYNSYGPTESTVCATYGRVSAGPDSRISIGRPISNRIVQLRNQFGNPVPVGVPGEIYIGGNGTALRYLNNSKLTQQRFVIFPDQNTERMYRTGDLGKWRPDGSIEFIARIDSQVKVNGHRVELEEIENVLHEIANGEFVCATSDDPRGTKVLAYYVSEEEIDVARLRTRLSGLLPYYMIPAKFIKAASIPMSPNGKIDRKALLSVVEVANLPTALSLGPVSETESMVLEVWKQILGVDDLAVNESFFSIGGNSIKVLKMQRSLNSLFNMDIPIAILFGRVTVRDISAYIDEHTKVGTDEGNKVQYLNF